MEDFVEKRYYDIEALNEYNILIPTWVEPPIVARILASILSYQQGVLSVDIFIKKYGKQIWKDSNTHYEPSNKPIPDLTIYDIENWLKSKKIPPDD